MKKFAAILLCVVMLLSMCACTEQSTGNTCRTADGGTKDIDKPVNAPDSSSVSDVTPLVYFAKSYGDVYEVLSELNEQNGELRDEIASDDVVEDSAGDMAVPEAGAGSGENDYSGTNVQVAGVDEGDIVKTDGKYIYLLSKGDFVVFSVDGETVKEVSRIHAGESKNESNENYNSSFEKYPSEMYVAGDRAAIVFDYWSFVERKDEENGWSYSSENYTLVEIYDISDRTAPKLLSSQGQGGSLNSSRLLDGKLYTVTSYYVYDVDEDNAETYIPRVYRDGDAVLMEADMICIPSMPSSSYTVVGVYDLESGETEDTKAVLASARTVYMDSERLLVAGGKQGVEKSEPRQESVYEVVDYANRSTTELTLFDVSEGEIDYLATAVVDGYLESQFSIDRYDGYFRIVTTENSYSYSVYTDKEMEFENVKWHDDERQYNSLYILDSNMNEVGSLEELAEDERVYSVRFDGDIVYFCTFREVDPLFTVDVSDPTEPKILSALKIPGFSEYLHVWQEGKLLFGLGQNTVEKGSGEESWITTDSMKLSMFDVSDPYNVTEKWLLPLEYSYSEALYNHKAILVSPEKNIIAFPTGSGYAVYGFSEDEGFFEKESANFDCGWNARGLWIENCFYVVSAEKITVLDMDTFDVLSEISVV